MQDADYEVIVRSKRFLFRKLCMSDLDDLIRFFTKPELTAFLDNDFDVYQTRGTLLTFIKEYETQGFGMMAGVGLDNLDEVKAVAGIRPITIEQGRQDYESIVYLAPDLWQQGYSLEGGQLLQDYVFNTLKLPRLIATIKPGHDVAIKLNEALGFEHRGVIHPVSGQKLLYVKDNPALSPSKPA